MSFIMCPRLVERVARLHLTIYVSYQWRRSLYAMKLMVRMVGRLRQKGRNGRN